MSRESALAPLRERNFRWYFASSTINMVGNTMAQSVRETDFIGWYEDQRVAGAVLTDVAEGRQNDSIRRTLDRIRRRFETDFPVAVSSRLDIRVNTIRDERAWS